METLQNRVNGQTQTDEVNAAAELAKQAERAPRGHIEFREDGSVGGYDFDGLWRLATMYSRSNLVPKHFQGQKEDCAIAIQMAQRCRVDILAYLQHCFIVHGRPGIEAKFAIAMLNQSGKITGTIQYDQTGEGATQRCRAWVVDATTGEKVYGPDVTWDMVRKEGWDREKKGMLSKWATMPGIMFAYRAAAFLIRTRYPEVILGIQTKEELEDIAAAEQPQSTPAPRSTSIQIPDDQDTDELPEPKADDSVTLSRIAERIDACTTQAELQAIDSETLEMHPNLQAEAHKAIQAKLSQLMAEAAPKPKEAAPAKQVPRRPQDKWARLAATLKAAVDVGTVESLRETLINSTCENEDELERFHVMVDERVAEVER